MGRVCGGGFEKVLESAEVSQIAMILSRSGMCETFCDFKTFQRPTPANPSHCPLRPTVMPRYYIHSNH